MSRPSGAVGLLTVTSWCTVGLLAPALAPTDPFAVDGSSLSAPTPAHPMGTDALGRDLLSAVINLLADSLSDVSGRS